MDELYHLGQWQIVFKILSGVGLAGYSHSLRVDGSNGFLVAVFWQARVVERWNVTCLVPGIWLTGTTTCSCDTCRSADTAVKGQLQKDTLRKGQLYRVRVSMSHKKSPEYGRTSDWRTIGWTSREVSIRSLVGGYVGRG